MTIADRLTAERFRELAQAYGSAIDRWPAEYGAAAAQMARSAEGAAILADAIALDRALDTWRVPLPRAELANRIVSGRIASRRIASYQNARPFNLRARVGLWLSGLGLAAGLAGAVAGVAAVSLTAPGQGSVSAETSFGEVAGQDS